ncbi:MAG: SRPBCC domain-containing protein [Deltaproteobacteria bacterium]|nr:SRPBCC domain-containing protein [Deltaproteobacteria bacterium]
MTSVGDQITVTTRVPIPPAEAFSVFTEELDVWWKRGPRFRPGRGQHGTLVLEPGVGGALTEHYQDDSPPYMLGRIEAWEPGQRLALRWHDGRFGDALVTQLEIRFEPVAGGTEVLLEHRGFDALPHDHPARDGLVGGDFISMVGVTWADQLVACRAHIGRRPSSA